MPSNAHHAGVRTVAVMMAAAIALLILPTVAHASHVETVSITPALGTIVADVCGPFWSRRREAPIPSGRSSTWRWRGPRPSSSACRPRASTPY
jgi:hypothetical protein